jgi:lipopolysaccharide transport system permease protein
MNQTTITKNTRFTLKELYSYRDLLFIFSNRHLKLRYRQTFLGIVWVLLQPLLLSSIFSLVFGKFASLPSNNAPYTLFALSAFIPWSFFFQTVHRASTTFTQERELIAKVYFPRILLPLSIACAVTVDFLVGTLLFLGLCLFYQYSLTLSILCLLLLFFPLFLFSCAMSIFFSSLNIFFRDISLIVPFFLQVGMYLCPIAYSVNLVPDAYLFYYHLNPLVGIIEAFRFSFLGLSTFPTYSFIYSCICSILLFLLSYLFFLKTERKFVDYL